MKLPLLSTLGLCLAFGLGAPAARAQTVHSELYITNGQVNAQVVVGNTLYVGGTFSSTGSVTGSGVPVDAVTGTAIPGFPRIDGQVTVALPDGSGGWFLGGLFTHVGSEARANLAHILPDDSLDPWTPNPNGQVRTLLISGDTLYVGGDFTTISAQGRNRIAAVEVSTWNLLTWNPNANGSVRALLKNGATIYAGGAFTNIGGQSRNRIAALSVATGAASSWNPNANSQVQALALAGDTLYVGGQFTAISGVTRNRLAAVSALTASAFGWNPNANNQVTALAFSNGVLYAGGQFTTAGGQTRNRVAALDAASGLATSWNPNSNNTVQCLLARGDTVYVGGDFTTLGAQSRSRIAAVSAVSGTVMAWNPAAFGSVSAIAYGEGQVMVGGSFSAIGGVRRTNLAAYDLATGQVTSWDPAPNNQVFALQATTDALLVGGAFTTIGGQIRNGIAAIDLTNGLATSWEPNADGMVSVISVAAGKAYVGGIFSTIGGQPRNNLAAIDLGSGLANAWDPNADGQVLSIEPSGSLVYVGGSFSVVGGAARDFLAALDTTSGVATGWNPSPTGTIRAIVPSCDRILVGGFFSNIGGQARNQLASLDPTTGLADSWNPDANGPVFSLVRGPGSVYVGGVITMVGGQVRNRLAALDPATGVATAWNPNVSGTVRSIVVHDDWLFAGGNFTTVSGTASGNMTAVSIDSSHACPVITLAPPPAPNGVVAVAYSRSAAASGGAAPYCYAVTAGDLPPGITLARGTGLLSGTPTTAGLYVFTLTATDAYGCTGSETYTVSVFATPVASTVAPNATNECLTPSQTCVDIPFLYTRGDTTPVRSISVTFQIENAKLALCDVGPPAASIHPGSWLDAFPNRTFQVTSLGGGAYTVDQVLLGSPCGAKTGGELFVVDLKSLGIDGPATVRVTSVSARDCANIPVGVAAGATDTVNVLGTPIVVLPAALSGGVAGASVSQNLSTTAGTAPLTYAVTTGVLPRGLTLAPTGLLSGTLTLAGTFNFSITATDAGGCSGTRAYSMSVTCPELVLLPSLLPDGAVGVAYSQALSTSPGLAPFTYAVTAGTLPAGLTLSAAGLLSGTPTEAGSSVLTLGVTDTAGCTASADQVMSIFATPPVSAVAANTTGLCISSANSCVTVPLVYTRDESAPVRAMSITLQIDPAMLALCTPAHPESSFHLGSMFAGHPLGSLQIVALGSGAYRADLVLLGPPCDVTSGGTALTLDVQSVAGDGLGAIGVLAVRSRDCDNAAIPVMAGPQAMLRILNTPITLLPPVLPNGLAGAAYSQALTTDSGLAPFSFTVTSGALPSGLTLSSAGVLSGTPLATGTFGFTVSVADVGGAPGSRSYSLTVMCQSIAVSPSTLPNGAVGIAYDQTLLASAGAAPFTWTVSAGSLPAGLTLSASTGQLSGTPTTPGTGVFTITATDVAGCSGSEDYLIAVFADPNVSMVSASTAGLCLSSVQPCVSVPFLFARGESAPARAVSVTFELDSTRLALCAPATPSTNVHVGSWLAAYPNRSLLVTALGAARYRVDLTVLGTPCGPTSGGELFRLDVQSVGPDGSGAITVTAVQVRDCDNVPLPGVPGPAAGLTVHHSAPTPISDLASLQLTTGNAPGSTTGIALTWSLPIPGTVSVYRAPFGAYPRYDEPGPVTSPSAAAAPGTPWTVVSTNALSGFVDHPPVRGFWHYVAFLTDSCGNRSSVSNLTPGSLNYHLGDVSDGVTRGTGDNRVTSPDLSLLGAHYGISGAAITTAGVSYLDVGPTTNGQLTARPVTDQTIDFEDLMVFSSNFRTVSAPQSRAVPTVAGLLAATSERFEVTAPSLVEPGAEVLATLRLSAAGGLQGFSARLAWDASVVEPIAMTSGRFVESQGGLVLSPRAGTIDAALLGSRATGLSGAGDVANLTFRVLREGDAMIRLEQVVARDRDNHSLASDVVDRATLAQVPTRTLLLSPWPNPAPGEATLAFALAESGPAELAIFSVDGRRVRTLATGRREAGIHRVTWAGEDGAHHAVAPGVYFVRLTTSTREYTRRLVYLR